MVITESSVFTIAKVQNGWVAQFFNFDGFAYHLRHVIVFPNPFKKHESLNRSVEVAESKRVS